MLYWDYAATTPPHEEVIQSMSEVLRQYYGNPSSLHRYGVQAEALVNKARDVIAAALGVKPKEILFTSGGTESNNLAIQGIARKPQNRGKHLITSMIEHAAVYECFKMLEAEGWRVTYLPVDETGAVRPEDLKAALCDDTVLVSIMYVNNEMGRIQPLQQIGALLREYPRVAFHVDAVQGFAKLPLDPKELGIDLLSASAHKFHGPKGCGFLYRREAVELRPLQVGGGQEQGLRPGTENVPGIVGMAKAVRMAMERLEAHAAQCARLRAIVAEAIGGMPQLALTGSADPAAMAPHIVHFRFPGMKSEVVVHALEQRGVCISTRSACASDEEQPSRVLSAMGLDRAHSVSGLRVSFSGDYTEEDAHLFCSKLKEVVEEFAATAASRNGARRT